MYLESVITHVLRGTAKTEELFPNRWKAAHPEAVRKYHEQEHRDKADTAVVQAARRRERAELRKGKQDVRRTGSWNGTHGSLGLCGQSPYNGHMRLWRIARHHNASPAGLQTAVSI
jgi:hypothetical protein